MDSKNSSSQCIKIPPPPITPRIIYFEPTQNIRDSFVLRSLNFYYLIEEKIKQSKSTHKFISTEYVKEQKKQPFEKYITSLADILSG